MEPKAILAVTFLVFAGITLVFPSLPPAQFLFSSMGISQTTFSLWGLPVGLLLTVVTNGCFWLLVSAAVYGIARFAKEPPPLPPMPKATRLTLEPPENTLPFTEKEKVKPTLASQPIASSRAGGDSSQTYARQAFAQDMFFRKLRQAEMDIQTIEGVGLVFGQELRRSGIDSVSKLLRVGSTERGRQRIAEEVRVTSATVLKWVHRGDLLRVRGIGSKYSYLLESAGVSSVSNLASQNPKHLCSYLKAFNKERNLVRRSPCSQIVRFWVENARHLEPV